MRRRTTFGATTLMGLGLLWAVGCDESTETGGTGGTSTSTSSSTTTTSTGSGGGDGGQGNTAGQGGATGGNGGSTSSGSGGGGGAFTCGDDNLECNHPQICVTFIHTTGPQTTTTWECHDDPCAPEALACTCAVPAICDDAPGGSCQMNQGNLECHSGGVCAAPNTPIATPQGDRPIAELVAGDLVYSLHEGRLQAVPLIRVSQRPVQEHAVVEVSLASGAVLHISAPHPTADGRSFGDLEPGSQLGDQAVVSVATLPYDHAYTYDILPASDTGTYLAAGALIGTTLQAP